MTPLSKRWTDLPDYILGVTREIWEDRGIATLNRYYADDIPVRTPMGIERGNAGVIAATMATINEFPDRQLLGEDVIWSDDPDCGLLSSHRIISTATHTRDGAFGPASGTRWTARIIADCAVRDDTIYDEWLVRDYGGIVRQLGKDPRAFAQDLVARRGMIPPASTCPRTTLMAAITGAATTTNGARATPRLLTAIMETDFAS